MLKDRMRERLGALGMSYAKLAEETGDDLKQVERWLGPRDHKIPADFAVRFCEATETNGHWLLTGDGPIDPPDADAYKAGAAEALAPLVEALQGAMRRAKIAPEEMQERIERRPVVEKAAAQLLKADREDGQTEGGPPTTEKRRRPRRRRGGASSPPANGSGPPGRGAGA